MLYLTIFLKLICVAVNVFVFMFIKMLQNTSIYQDHLKYELKLFLFQQLF